MMHFFKATVSTKIETMSRAPNTLWYFLCKIVKQTRTRTKQARKSKIPFLTFDKLPKFLSPSLAYSD